mgnify:CR=1 FL=1
MTVSLAHMDYDNAILMNRQSEGLEWDTDNHPMGMLVPLRQLVYNAWRIVKKP